MDAPGGDAACEAMARLEALSADLAVRGFETSVAHPDRKLNVANREVPEVRDAISAAPADDGTWWFLWSWGDRIAPVADIEQAVFKIAYVLNPMQI